MLMGVKIIYEDESILVLDKPAEMTVNRSDTTRDEQTLQDWIEGRGIAARGPVAPSSHPTASVASSLQSLDGTPSGRATPSEELSGRDYEEDNREAFYKRSGIVHRLDKETSGIILVAKTEDAFISLLRQFREREVEKKYTALVHGKIAPETGEINVPVGRLPWNRKRFGIVAGGREAVTRYRVITNYTLNAISYTLLELEPKTGRTHQIRVHLKYMGNPIFADSLYGGRKTAREDKKKLSRQFLHASSISFSHPKTHKPLSFQSNLPQDLADVLSQMQTA